MMVGKRAALAQFTTDGHAVLVRQHQIQHQQLRRNAGDRCRHLRAVGIDGDLHAGGTEVVSQQPRNFRFVFGDQHVRLHGG